MSEHLLLGLLVFTASAGLIVLVHSSPLPIPNIRPINCAFCTIVWTSWVLWSFADKNVGVESLLIAASFPLFAGILVGVAPWLFRTFDQEALKERSNRTTGPYTTKTEFNPTDVPPAP